MSNQKTNPDSPLQKIDAELNEVDTRVDKARKEKGPPVRNNDSTVAPEKDQNDVLRRHG
ncbi:MAG: hypothetical protein Q7T66_07800 [Herminiimonas sp.]|uniref:hypothetical protein n=1 Tax=Herminiimonas sp. TaxID=1926289 RepID=UPI00271C90FC|nr:hypothetical protein [Herminiimonas sp.]MDO9420548.1 hypothetical protein [Herminiimonas sp.]